tara:strand:- start:1381 stop:2367 length:987 start_codon:yes stop_codon:yes gene_type:complete
MQVLEETDPALHSEVEAQLHSMFMWQHSENKTAWSRDNMVFAYSMHTAIIDLAVRFSETLEDRAGGGGGARIQHRWTAIARAAGLKTHPGELPTEQEQGVARVVQGMTSSLDLLRMMVATARDEAPSYEDEDDGQPLPPFRPRRDTGRKGAEAEAAEEEREQALKRMVRKAKKEADARVPRRRDAAKGREDELALQRAAHDLASLESLQQEVAAGKEDDETRGILDGLGIEAARLEAKLARLVEAYADRDGTLADARAARDAAARRAKDAKDASKSKGKTWRKSPEAKAAEAAEAALNEAQATVDQALAALQPALAKARKIAERTPGR